MDETINLYDMSKETIEQKLEKYKKYVGNIEWHIKTNNPPDEWVKNNYKQLGIYHEIISDLEELQAGEPVEVNNGWISVEGSTINDNEWLLLYNGKWIGVGKVLVAQDMDDNDVDVWENEKGLWITPTPTHWRYLPPPPKH